MKNLVTSVLLVFVFTLLLGIGYPLAVWAIAQLVFPREANGSLISKDGNVVGSELIGQKFTGPGYFQSRPSSAGHGYGAAASSGSNFGPTSAKLFERVDADIKTLTASNPDVPIPADLVTSSASGLDPHISPAGAEFQIPRVAEERGLNETEVRSLVESMTEPRQLGILGEPRVNVLLLNLELDKLVEK